MARGWNQRRGINMKRYNVSLKDGSAFFGSCANQGIVLLAVTVVVWVAIEIFRMASCVASGNSSCTASFPRGSTTVRTQRLNGAAWQFRKPQSAGILATAAPAQGELR
jgi:hypothetical protein